MHLSDVGRIRPNAVAAKTVAIAPGVLAATVVSTGMIAQQVAGKAVRDALFLSSYKVSHLPHAMAAASVVSLGVVMCLPMVTTRITPRRFLPLLFGGSAVGLVLERLLYQAMPHLGALAVYLHVSTVAPVIITTFWGLINERFDPHTAKREVARIAGGGTIGGVLGGLAAWRASTLISLPSSILVLAGINLLCLGAVITIRAPVNEKTKTMLAPTDEPPTLAALRLFKKAPFLRNLAILVGTGAALSSLLDYVLSVQAVAHLGRGPNLLAFFSLFGLGVSILSMILQVIFGRIAMEKVNLAVHLGILPGVIVLGGAFGLAVPGLISTVILRAAEMIQRNTFFRSAYELLYTPIPELHKRATKALIDVGFDRAGTILGALVTMASVFLISSPGHAQHVILGIVVVGAVCTLPLVRSLHVNYVDALEQSLRAGARHHAKTSHPSIPSPDSADVEPLSDGPLSQLPPSVALEQERDREKLIHAMQKIAPQPDDQGLAHAALTDPTQLIALHDELLSRDEARMGAALGRFDRWSRVAAGPVILLLAHPRLHKKAQNALIKLNALIAGQLVDAMIDPEMDFVVRRRIPPVLAKCPSQRAAEGLMTALSDLRFEVRYAAGRALMRMPERESIELPRDQIVKIILQEIDREHHYADKLMDKLGDEELEGDALAPLDVFTRDRVSRGLEHLFNELAILLGSEAVRICFRALHQEDARSRGTALEYLQTVLPPELRDAIWPLLGEEIALPSVRPAGEVLEDLTRAMERQSV